MGKLMPVSYFIFSVKEPETPQTVADSSTSGIRVKMNAGLYDGFLEFNQRKSEFLNTINR